MLRMGRSESKIKCSVVSHYDNWLSITWKNEYWFDNTVKFYFESSEEADLWQEQLSAKIAGSGDGSFPSSAEPCSPHKRGEELLVEASAALTSTMPVMSPPQSLVTSPRAQQEAGGGGAGGGFKKKNRRSNSLNSAEGRKWSELVPRVLRRDNPVQPFMPSVSDDTAAPTSFLPPASGGGGGGSSSSGIDDEQAINDDVVRLIV